MLQKNKIKKILFITLSNIGDCILSLPALDAILQQFPQAQIEVMVGPRPSEIFEGNPRIKRLIVYDKYASLKDKIKLILNLRRQRYDLIIDLRNTALPLLLNVSYRTTPFSYVPKKIVHMKDRYLYKLKKITGNRQQATGPRVLFASEKDSDYINKLLGEGGVSVKDRIVVVSPGARNMFKRWKMDGFVKACERLIEDCKVKVVMVGDKKDLEFVNGIIEKMKNRVVNLCGRTNLKALGALLSKAHLLICNDSAVMHLGSYLDIPILAIFGPTHPLKYRPWSRRSMVVRADLACSPCQKSICKAGHECMELVKPEEVLEKAAELLNV